MSQIDLGTQVSGTLASSHVAALTIAYTLNSGAVATNACPQVSAVRAGSFTKCVVTTTASDGATALSFRIKKNGTDIFSADPSVAAATASGTVSTFTSLTTSPLTVAAGDVFEIDVLTGTSSWIAVIQLA